MYLELMSGIVQAMKQENKKIADAQNWKKINSMTEQKENWETVTDS